MTPNSDNSRIAAAFRRKVADALGPRRHIPLIVGVSGGADSVALLVTLHALNVDISASHCDFHLRGEESDRDRMFTVDLCNQLGIPLDIVHFDIHAYIASHPSTSIEMACRQLRYAHWKNLLAKTGAEKIALAHNSDDNAETVLLNLFRGSGSRGLSGIPAETDIAIRPLLGISRAEIIEYLQEIGQPYVTDSSNLHDEYLRNFIRLTLLPSIESRCPGIRTSLLRTASIMSEEQAIVSDYLDKAIPSGSNVLPIDIITASPAPVTLIHHFLRPAYPSDAIPAEILECIRKGNLSGRHWLTDTHRIDGERDGIHILPLEDGNDRIPEMHWTDILNSDTTLNLIKSDRSNRSVFVAGDISSLRLRHPKEGDRIQPIGMKGSRLVSDVMKDAHLTAAQKRATLLLEDTLSGKIIWIKGLCRSRHMLVSEKDSTIWRGSVRH